MAGIVDKNRQNVSGQNVRKDLLQMVALLGTAKILRKEEELLPKRKILHLHAVAR